MPSVEISFGEGPMTIPQELEQLLATMNRAEKAQLLQRIVRELGDAFPGIESNPLVCGGEPCIVRTRIPIWVLVQSRNLGLSEADILRSYPPELCRGVAILSVLGPLRGRRVVPPTSERPRWGVPRDPKEAKPSSCCQERPFLPVSERTSPPMCHFVKRFFQRARHPNTAR